MRIKLLSTQNTCHRLSQLKLLSRTSHAFEDSKSHLILQGTIFGASQAGPRTAVLCKHASRGVVQEMHAAWLKMLEVSTTSGATKTFFRAFEPQHPLTGVTAINPAMQASQRWVWPDTNMITVQACRIAGLCLYCYQREMDLTSIIVIHIG